MDKNQFVIYMVLTALFFLELLPRINGVKLRGGFPTALGLGLCFRAMNIPIQKMVLTPIFLWSSGVQSGIALALTVTAAFAVSLLISSALLKFLSAAYTETFELDSWTAAAKCAVVLTLLRLVFAH